MVPLPLACRHTTVARRSFEAVPQTTHCHTPRSHRVDSWVVRVCERSAQRRLTVIVSRPVRQAAPSRVPSQRRQSAVRLLTTSRWSESKTTYKPTLSLTYPTTWIASSYIGPTGAMSVKCIDGVRHKRVFYRVSHQRSRQ